MKTTTATAIEQQSLIQDFVNNLNESNFEVLSDIGLELESILVEEFEQGLPSDLETFH